MNMQSLMAQAKKIQKDLEEQTKQIEGTVFVGENDYIKIEMMGDYKVKQITILNKEVLSDEEMLEDMMTLAINSVTEKIINEKNNKLGKYTGGMGGLF